MISYVLLVTIAIIMSIVVFTYLRYVANVEPVIDCKDGTSIVIEDYTCEVGKIQLVLRNNGRFNVNGSINFFGGNSFREPTVKLITLDTPRLTVKGDYEFEEPLRPGETIVTNFSADEKKPDGSIGPVSFDTIKNLKIQPYVIDDETGLVVPCGGEIKRQDVEDCRIKDDIGIHDPIAHYKFDGDLEDSTPFKNRFVIAGNKDPPTYEESLFGQGAKFIVAQRVRSFKIHNDLKSDRVSIGLWIKIEKGSVFEKRDVGALGNGQKGFSLRGDKTKIEWFAGGLGGEPYAVCDGTFNNWKYLTLTAVTGGKKKIYVNGELCAEEDTGVHGLNSENNNLYLGGFDGTVDEMKVWDRVLTPEQIVALYSSYV